MSDSNTQDMKYGEDYSLMTETINYILVAADCPKSFHTYLYCLIATANEQIEFEASDLDVSRHARQFGGNINKETAKGWARDRRRALMKWQDEKNITLVEVTPGKRGELGKREFIKTFFKLYLVEYAKQVIFEAKSQKATRFGNQSTALRKAANDLLDKLRSQPIDRNNPSHFDPPTEVLKNLRTARTFLEKAARLLKKYKFKLNKSDEELIQEIEKYISSIKDRGYVENILDSIIFDSIKDDE